MTENKSRRKDDGLADCSLIFCCSQLAVLNTLKESSRQRPRSAMSRKTPWRSPGSNLMHFAEPAIWPSSIRTEDPTCANHVDVLTVWSVFPSNVHINILRGLPCRLESLRLKFTNEPSIFVDGDLDESIKRNASDRLGDLVPQVRARTSPGVFRDMALLGLCLELSFSVLNCRTQANLPTLSAECVNSYGNNTPVKHDKKIQS